MLKMGDLFSLHLVFCYAHLWCPTRLSFLMATYTGCGVQIKYDYIYSYSTATSGLSCCFQKLLTLPEQPEFTIGFWWSSCFSNLWSVLWNIVYLFDLFLLTVEQIIVCLFLFVYGYWLPLWYLHTFFYIGILFICMFCAFIMHKYYILFTMYLYKMYFTYQLDTRY